MRRRDKYSSRRILIRVNVYSVLQEWSITPPPQLGASCSKYFLPKRTVGKGGKEYFTRGETDA